MGQNQSKIALASGDDAEYKAYKASEGQEKGTWKGMPSNKVVKEKAIFKGTAESCDSSITQQRVIGTGVMLRLYTGNWKSNSEWLALAEI